VARSDGWGWVLRQSQPDRSDDTLKVDQHVRSGKSQRPVAFVRQHRIAIGIMPSPLRVAVLATINLNGNPVGMAGEIQDILPERNLPTEMKPILPQAAQRDPKPRFRWRERAAQGAGMGDGGHRLSPPK